MKKLFLMSAISSIILFSTSVFAEKTLNGELFNIMPRKGSKMSETSCKAHAPDTYKSTPSEINKQIKADNGVSAKDLGYKTREEGGIIIRTGKAEFSGVYEDKSWKETAHYTSVLLDKDSGVQQGAWYTKNCKGFFRVESD